MGTPTPSIVLRGHSSAVECVHFPMEHSRMFLSGDQQGNVIIWAKSPKTSVGLVYREISRISSAHSRSVLSIGSWDDTSFFTLGRDGIAKWWNYERLLSNDNNMNMNMSNMNMNMSNMNMNMSNMNESMNMNVSNGCVYAMECGGGTFCNAIKIEPVSYSNNTNARNGNNSNNNDDGSYNNSSSSSSSSYYPIFAAADPNVGTDIALYDLRSPSDRKSSRIGSLCASDVSSLMNNDPNGSPGLAMCISAHNNVIDSSSGHDDNGCNNDCGDFCSNSQLNSGFPSSWGSHHNGRAISVGYEDGTVATWDILQRKVMTANRNIDNDSNNSSDNRNNTMSDRSYISKLVSAKSAIDDPILSLSHVPTSPLKSIFIGSAGNKIHRLSRSSVNDSIAKNNLNGNDSNSIDSNSNNVSKSTSLLSSSLGGSLNSYAITSDKCIEFDVCESLKLGKETDILTKSGVGSVSIRKDGKIAATGGWDHRVRIFDAKRGKPLAILRHHRGTVSSLDWSPHETHLLASGSHDCRIAMWLLYPPKK